LLGLAAAIEMNSSLLLSVSFFVARKDFYQGVFSLPLGLFCLEFDLES